jgi:hypothetical protein
MPGSTDLDTILATNRERSVIGGTAPRGRRGCRSFVTPDSDPESNLSRVRGNDDGTGEPYPRVIVDRHQCTLFAIFLFPNGKLNFSRLFHGFRGWHCPDIDDDQRTKKQETKKEDMIL